MFVFGVIPARGGSKGLPGKNLEELGGKPLIAWSIAAAKQSRLLSRTIVSTEDAAIAEAARRGGAEVPFIRPAELAKDDSRIVDVLKHAVRWLESSEKTKPDIIVLLQPTSPLRSAQDIDATIQLVLDSGADSAQTVREDHSHPWHRFTLAEDGRLAPLRTETDGFSRRQQAPPLYLPSGSVYAMRRAVLMEQDSVHGKDNRGLVRGFERSIDIDSVWDFRMAELILKQEAAKSA